MVGGFGTLPGKLIWPTSVTTSPEGDLVVKDSGTGHIQIYNSDGRFKQRFPYGFEPIKGLGDVTCMKSGVILVTNGTRVIQLFSKDGELIHELKSPKLTWPYSYGITVMQSNKIAVSDWSEGGKINIIGVDWRMNAILKTHAIEGFHRPVRIAVSKTYVSKIAGICPRKPIGSLAAYRKNEDLLVTEGQLFGRFQGCCIKVIDKERHLKKTIGPRYGKTFRFENPSGISVDSHGNVFAADEEKNCIVMFNPDSSLSALIVSEGLQGPSGLSVMEHGLLAVADCYNHCVKIFSASINILYWGPHSALCLLPDGTISSTTAPSTEDSEVHLARRTLRWTLALSQCPACLTPGALRQAEYILHNANEALPNELIQQIPVLH